MNKSTDLETKITVEKIEKKKWITPKITDELIKNTEGGIIGARREAGGLYHS